ncbi:MAG: M14 family zinc carboxypeptidase [Flavobacteriia bacterium]|nr:hypothetical protein [Cryomorphaceae bacterium]
MIRIFLSALYCSCFLFASHSQWTENQSPSYPELIAHLEKLDAEHKEIELYAMGPSDYGLPIYLCVINGAQDSTKTMAKARKETTILINNAIHAGEPDGINACLIWLDNWIKGGKKTKNLPVIAFIPAYNVGGMMHRGTSSRANQNGPEEYGFRGNAQNLDLNRDFLKMDSQNAFTFAKIYHALNPDVFIDTHVSNGADYQYTLTFIASMRERMAPGLGSLLYDDMIPALTNKLKDKKWDLFPYVELVGETPEKGIHAFNDLPRYAMGYAALFDAMSFTIETHMLKPFPERVKATHDMIDEVIHWTDKNRNAIENERNQAVNYWRKQEHFKFNYSLTEKKDSIRFKGFEHSYPFSEITGLPRLKYHQDKPYEQFIPHFNTYEAKDSVFVPEAFIVGAQCRNIIERLVANGIQFSTLQKDTLIQLGQERVIDFKTISRPYEGHYYHSEVKTEVEKAVVQFKAGDIIVLVNQPGRNFILSALTPKAEDSYFRWNYMDSYLQQKEYFSAYVFEDRALEILAANPWLKEELETLKAANKEFRESQNEQLYFIYKNSPYFEDHLNVLPVFILSNFQ